MHKKFVIFILYIKECIMNNKNIYNIFSVSLTVFKL